MAIQSEVTLQPDYTCCLRVMGGKSCIAEIVILSPCQHIRWSLSSTIVNTSCVNVLFTKWRHKVATLVVTANYNTSIGEETSVFAVWSTGNAQG